MRVRTGIVRRLALRQIRRSLIDRSERVTEEEHGKRAVR